MNLAQLYSFCTYTLLSQVVHQIIYSSRAKDNMTLTTLTVLLMQARALNERKHITGALVYGDGQFMQIMEGEEDMIRDLYERVVRDPRHHDVRKLVDRSVAKRSFAQWSMAFGEVPADMFQKLSSIPTYRTPEQLFHHLPSDTESDTHLLDKMKEIVQASKQH
ncbi:MAG: BLUF domain-containing protein [Hymenobacter sp.]|nr:MAG: BLUF domain-containing protein [Hymenobacter sp.]